MIRRNSFVAGLHTARSRSGSVTGSATATGNSNGSGSMTARSAGSGTDAITNSNSNNTTSIAGTFGRSVRLSNLDINTYTAVVAQQKQQDEIPVPVESTLSFKNSNSSCGGSKSSSYKSSPRAATDTTTSLPI